MIKQLFENPPLATTLISLLVTMIPPLRYPLITPGSFLNRSVFNTAQVIGNISPPMVLLVLGATLFLNHSIKSRMKFRTILWVTLIRLIINPIIGGLILYILYSINWMPDPV